MFAVYYYRTISSLNINALPNSASRSEINNREAERERERGENIKNDSRSAICRALPTFAINTSFDVYIRIARGVRERKAFRLHVCTYIYIYVYTKRTSVSALRARADAWVRATRERCAGRLFRYCCYCWGNNRPSIGRLGTMYLFRCGQRCSIDRDPTLRAGVSEKAGPTIYLFFREMREVLVLKFHT